MNDIPAGIPVAAPWSLFMGSLGRGSVVASIVLFVLALVGMAVAARSPRLEKIASGMFVAGCIALFAAFGALTTLFVQDQFQYGYVWQHSDTKTSLAYKIASVWTAQEGSFLLWAVCAALFAVLALPGTGPYRRPFVGTSALILATLGGILAYESPFEIMKEVVQHGKTFIPTEGSGMVPSLQNYWVIIHPPTIFLGFGSLSLLAAYAVAAMLRGDAEDWVARVRPWALLSTAVLGLGVAMGGLWAYETQGWGGFWAWDPVENVSFVPWLLGVAFAHGLIVQAARRKWAGTNLFLGGAPFLLFVYGTFLTRSGLLDKVSNHSFASMDDHARGILRWALYAAVALFVGIFMVKGVPAARVANAHAQPEETGANREGFLRYGLLLLSLLSAVIALGMSWPVITAARGGQGSRVEESLYHLVVVWFFLPLMVLMAITPFVSWRRMEGKVLRERLFGVLCISFGITGLLHLMLLSTPLGVHPQAGATVAAPFGRHIPLALWMLVLLLSVVFVVVANVWRTVELMRRSAMGTGGFVAHLGLAVLLGGLILSRGYERKATLQVSAGSSATALGYTVTYRGTTTRDPFDRDRKVEFDVTTPSGTKFVARPGHYQYKAGEDTKDQVWPAIERYATHDVYLAMGPPQMFVTPEPLRLKPGESQDLGGSIVEFLEPTRKGEFGKPGTQFGAKLRLTTHDDLNVAHQYLASPTLTLGEDGLTPSIPHFGPDLRVALLGMDASDKSMQVALLFDRPPYPMELYEKPYTGLVWLGTGVLTLGGLMSAFARRRVLATRRRTAPTPRSDAPLPTP